MKSKNETFSKLLSEFTYHYDLPTVFDDFLTMTLCAFSQNPRASKSYDEELYLQTIEKYKDNKLRYHFPKMLACLTLEMEHLKDSCMGNDVLGDCYMEHFSKKGFAQFFTPWTVCEFMAMTICGDNTKSNQRVLDPCCGSGRLLLCGAKHIGKGHRFYGIDIDHVCVKMTAINLFLNGIFHSEVMWADALAPDDFRMSYKISFLPFGVFRISNKEQSELWYLHKHSFRKQKTHISLPSEDGNRYDNDAPQLTLF